MLKDIHYYAIFALAIENGFSAEDAATVAHSSQFADDCDDINKEVDYAKKFKYSQPIITQNHDYCLTMGSNYKHTIEHFVYMPFHYIPGDMPQLPTVCTAGSRNSRRLINYAIKEQSLAQLGIALHTLVDTYSHQGFSGYEEDVNSVYFWKAPYRSLIPDIGHADVLNAPDEIETVWSDHRQQVGKKTIDNKIRAQEALYAASLALYCYKNQVYFTIPKRYAPIDNNILLFNWVFINEYDDRINHVSLKYDTIYDINYFYTDEKYAAFQDAAKLHLAAVLKY